MRRVLLLAGCACEVSADGQYDVARAQAIARARDHRGGKGSSWMRRFTQPDKLEKRARSQTKQFEASEPAIVFNGAPLIGDGDPDVELVVRRKAFGGDVMSYDLLLGFEVEEYTAGADKDDLFAKVSREDYASHGRKNARATVQQHLFKEHKDMSDAKLQAKIQEYIDRYNIDNFRPDGVKDRGAGLIPTSLLQKEAYALAHVEAIRYDDEVPDSSIQRYKRLRQVDAASVPRFVRDQWRRANVATTNDMEGARMRTWLDSDEANAVTKTFSAWDAAAHQQIKNALEAAAAERSEDEAVRDAAWQKAIAEINGMAGPREDLTKGVANIRSLVALTPAEAAAQFGSKNMADTMYEIDVRLLAKRTTCLRKTFLTLFDMDCVLDDFQTAPTGCLSFQMPTRDQLTAPNTKRRVRFWLKHASGTDIDGVLETLSNDYPEGDIESSASAFQSVVWTAVAELCELDTKKQRNTANELRNALEEAHGKSESSGSLLQVSNVSQTSAKTRGEVLQLDENTVEYGMLAANSHILGDSEEFGTPYSDVDETHRERLDASAHEEGIAASWATNPDIL